MYNITYKYNWHTYQCGCGCALLTEPYPCWHSCSSCTYTFHRRSSPGRPSAHPTHPPLTGSPPLTEAPCHSARLWGQLKTNWCKYFILDLEMYGCMMYDTLFPPAWNDAPDSFSPQTEPEIMLTCWVCWVKYSWNSLTKSTGSVLISSISFHGNEPPKKMRGQEDVWQLRFHVHLSMTYNAWRRWPKHPNDDASSLLLTTMLMPPC